MSVLLILLIWLLIPINCDYYTLLLMLWLSMPINYDYHTLCA